MTKVNLEKIKQLRKSQKLSQSDMAKILGFNTLYPYHRKESGSQPFTADEIHAIAKYFNVPVEYFFAKSIAKNATGKNTA
jgi:putative transcriptional regulator